MRVLYPQKNHDYHKGYDFVNPSEVFKNEIFFVFGRTLFLGGKGVEILV